LFTRTFDAEIFDAWAGPSVEDLGIEGTGEQPAVVMVGLGHQGDHPGEPGRFDTHPAMVA